MKLRWVVVDFETASAIDLKRAGAWRYAEDPTTEIICLSYSVMGEEPRTWFPGGEGYEALLELVKDEHVTFIAHNAAFEKAIWRNIMVWQFGWPDIPNSRWHDTMAVCAMKVIPQDLDHAAIVMRLEHQKDKEGAALVKSLSKPNKKTGRYDRSPETLKRVYAYCEQDVRTEVSMHERIGWLPPGERSVWLLDQRINERGVRLDLDYIRAAQQIVDRASIPLLAEFAGITGGLKPSQTAKFKDWIAVRGTDLPNLTKETLDEILGSEDEEDDDNEPSDSDVVLDPAVHRALSIRRLIGSASVKKLARMDACVGADGRARGLLQYHGAGPGRWAGRLFQPQNFPRGSIDRDKLGKLGIGIQEIIAAILTGDPEWVETLIGPPVETVVSALRHSITCDPGRALISGDFATIEARIVLALAGQYDKVQLLADGKDIYIDMAQEIYKRPIDKKKDPEERQTGKNSVLGLGFGMGPPKFQFKYAKKHPIEFAQNIVSVYRNDWAPEVPKLWRGLFGAAVRTVHDGKPHDAYGVLYQLEDGWLTALLPSGRKLWYKNPRPCREAMPWDETDIRLGFTYEAKKMGQWKTIKAFGGLLTENVVQALARDLLVTAMFKCERNGLPIVLTVHDEIVSEPEIANADEKALDQIMRDKPAWASALQIPVATETWMGDRYRK